ncbi:MAG: nitric oxide reductase activation protein [Pseudomonadota bacterium]|nr:MAG: nitric oxide reductase activation protein [Pseudomonadota bacterium]
MEPSDSALSAGEIATRLGKSLEGGAAAAKLAELSEALARLPRRQQELALRWGRVIAKTNGEMAAQFLIHVPRALTLLDTDGVGQWALNALDVYDREGLYPGCAALKDVAAFAATAKLSAHAIDFEQVRTVLEHFVQGLSGRRLHLAAGPEVYTDTDTLFLPARISEFSERRANFDFYKAIVAHLWAQTWYGSFRLPTEDGDAIGHERVMQSFYALETVRLDACIARDLPGLARDMAALQARVGAVQYPPSWTPALARMRAVDATARDSLHWAKQLPDDALGALPCYQGRLFPERAAAAIETRVARDSARLRRMLAQVAVDEQARRGARPARRQPKEAVRFRMLARPQAGAGQESTFELQLDGAPIEPGAELRALLGSLLQDLGEIPPHLLASAPDSSYTAHAQPDDALEDTDKGFDDTAGTVLYDEWDYQRKHYRKDWCVLREIDLDPVNDDFVAQTLRKYAATLPGLRKTFEALRGEQHWLRRQTNGDDIDLDALIEARAEMRHGHELTDRLFTRQHKIARHIAVLFMVDMSGSTKGWINDAEREALVLLCEALEILGDNYAIYGFSGQTRKRCEIYRIKRFGEPYDDTVRGRISAVAPKDYTRMGVSIRHLTKLLSDVDARTRLLITLSDGKPDDYDGYRGDYGVEDTRQALIEARRAGIHPFCITIDESGRDYLPHMYGAVNWTLVDDVRRLPLKVSDIYRRLTH